MALAQRTHNDYTVAWICALPLEAAPAVAMLDEKHPRLPQPPGDDNVYTLGEIAGHNIVIAHLPCGVYGTTSAATVAAQMRSTFPSIRFALMVGIGGGVPSAKNDIRLGDVVVSKPTGVYGGVVQYDYGKTVSSGLFQQTGMMNQPPQVLLNAIAQLQMDEFLHTGKGLLGIVSSVLSSNPGIRAFCSQPVMEHDRLYCAKYDHAEEEEDTCVNCQANELVDRPPRIPAEPNIHYGLIASGNKVMKHGETRDRLAKEHGMLCFEMEAAGLMNQIPCLVIRGICDYSDSHKSKEWQGFAALTGAAYTKMLLCVVPASQGGKKDEAALQPACWVVPFERNARFLGRGEVLEIENRISSQKVRKMALAGLGGVGKTQIALELAYRIRDMKPDYSVFWVPSTSMEMLEQAFMGMCQHLGLRDVTPADVRKRVKAHLSSEKAGPWLLIIDNADDIDMWMTSDLKASLPQSRNGFIFFTTRNRQLATKLVGPEVIVVSAMDDKMARGLLRESLINKDLMKDRRAAAQLLHQLSCLPLGIIQAASYINENDITLATYLALLHEQEDELLSQDFENEWRYADNKNPVVITWLISFHQIQRLNTLAAEYLSFMACVNPREIPQSLLQTEGSRLNHQNALGLLKAYSFVTSQADGFITLHRLVHLATRGWLRNNGLLEGCTARVGKRLNEVFPSNDPIHRRLWREYLPHAQYLLQSNEVPHDERVWDPEDLAYKVAECLFSDGRYYGAEELFRDLVNKRRSPPIEIDRDMLHLMARLATTYYAQGRWTKAEELEVQVVQARKAILGPDHPKTLLSIANLASTYYELGRLSEAQALLGPVVEARKSVLGPDHPETLSSKAKLAFILYQQGRLAESEELETHVMEKRRLILGPDHPDTLLSFANLAATYYQQGRYAEAERLGARALDGRRSVLGPDHPDTLNSLINHAYASMEIGRLPEAEKMVAQVLEKRRAVLGFDHPDTYYSLASLAAVYHEQGRLVEAEEMQRLVLEGRQTVLGRDHPETLRSMRNLPVMLDKLGRRAEALTMLRECWQLMQRRLGMEHADTVDVQGMIQKWETPKRTGAGRPRQSGLLKPRRRL